MPPPQSQKKTEGGQQHIRTYQSDVEEVMRKEKISKATIAIAENKRVIAREEVAPLSPVPVTPPAQKAVAPNGMPVQGRRVNFRLILILLVGSLVIIGIGVGTFFYVKDATRPAVLAPKTKVPLTHVIALQGGEKRAGAIQAIRTGLQAISVPQNQIKTIPITLGGIPMTNAMLVATLEATPPQTLMRALGTVPVLGLHGFQGGQPFLLFQVLSYDHAFAGMLAWETTLLTEIGPMLGVSPRTILGDIGSTTTEALSSKIAFKDVIIRNKDARAAFDPAGNIVFLYSFIDKQTLVWTVKEDTLRFLQNKAGGGRLK